MDGRRASELNIGIGVGMKKCKQICNTKKDQQKDDSVSSWALAQCCYRELQIQSNVFVVNDLYNQTCGVSRSPVNQLMIYVVIWWIYAEHLMNHSVWCNFLWLPKIVSIMSSVSMSTPKQGALDVQVCLVATFGSLLPFCLAPPRWGSGSPAEWCWVVTVIGGNFRVQFGCFRK